MIPPFIPPIYQRTIEGYRVVYDRSDAIRYVFVGTRSVFSPFCRFGEEPSCFSSSRAALNVVCLRVFVLSPEES